MPLYAVWVDREEVRIFRFDPEQQMEKLKASHQEHHTHRRDALDFQKEERSFYKSLAPKLDLAKKILLLGPGVAKYHFQAYLNEQHPALARKIVGCESSDHPTEGEIAARAARFFKRL